MLLHVSIVRSFILISTVPWNRYSKDWLAACHQKTVGLFPGFGHCEQFAINICIDFFWCGSIRLHFFEKNKKKSLGRYAGSYSNCKVCF